jgi:L-asparaginase/Glu-tRNA(Gln) amidotransferase subunit D
MANGDQAQERKVSVSVNIRSGSMTQSQALELENKLRDVCDDYEGVDISVTHGAERPTFRP